MLNSNNEALATSLYLISFMLSESSFQGDNTLHTFHSFITIYQSLVTLFQYLSDKCILASPCEIHGGQSGNWEALSSSKFDFPLTAPHPYFFFHLPSTTWVSNPPGCTGVLINPQPYQEGNKLQQPNSKFCKPLQKKNAEGCPSNQVSAAAMTSASDEKLQFFFCRVGIRTYQHPCIMRPEAIFLNFVYITNISQ